VTSDNGRYDPTDTVTYPPREFMAMPYRADGTHPTSFDRPCAAYIEFLQTFKRRQLGAIAGQLFGRELQDLLDWINEAE
jgi:hypothetical protein